MALEAAWPMLLCTRTKVILSLRSSLQVGFWLLVDDDYVSMAFLCQIKRAFVGVLLILTSCSF